MGKKTLLISTFFFILTIVFFDLTDVDFYLQDKLYNFEANRWYFDDPTKIYHLLFYTLIKYPIYLLGFYALFRTIKGKIKKESFNSYRNFLIVFLTLVILPGGIAVVGKKAINVQCPSDIPRYGGTVPFVKLFDPYPPNPNSKDGKWPNGHCWPAGHCSGGFALFSLYLLARNKKEKLLSIFVSFLFAIPMAYYQTVRGAHYLSHTLSTLFLAFMVISILNILIKKEENNESKNN